MERAIAAVTASDPQFLGYAPVVPGRIGDGPHVVVERDEAGWLLTFVNGSGDCFAGCINHAFAKFRVSSVGTVSELCRWQTEADRVVEGRPC